MNDKAAIALLKFVNKWGGQVSIASVRTEVFFDLIDEKDYAGLLQDLYDMNCIFFVNDLIHISEQGKQAVIRQATQP